MGKLNSNNRRDEVSVAIVSRFFDAYYAMKEAGKICGICDYCQQYNIDRGAFYKQKSDYTYKLLDVSWLVPLVDAGVSARWLLTGKGNMTRKNAVTL